MSRSSTPRSRSHQNVLAPLRDTQIIGQKAVLPAEILSSIIDYLPISDLFRFALVSRRMQEMVYDDTRWVQRLKLMGCWNELEARKRTERDFRRRHPSIDQDLGLDANGSVRDCQNSGRGSQQGSTTILDTVTEGSGSNVDTFVNDPAQEATQSVEDGFEELSITGSGSTLHKPNRDALINVFLNVKSARGQARQEYGKIHALLWPLYLNVVRSQGLSNAVIFHSFRDPEDQARILSLLLRFEKGDVSLDWETRKSKLQDISEAFEDAALREFERGCHDRDVHGSMQKYARVLVHLNGGQKALQTFLDHNPIFSNRYLMGNPLDCLDSTAGHILIQPANDFFHELGRTIHQERSVINAVFPNPGFIFLKFLERVAEMNVSEYITSLFDEAHNKSMESYLKLVPGVYEQASQFARSLGVSANAPDDEQEDAPSVFRKVFEAHVELYLKEEIDHFRHDCNSQVSTWEKKRSEEDASTESFYMSNVNRQADKRDFLSSFKKVVMMPVNVLPTMSFGKSTSANSLAAGGLSRDSSRSATPGLTPAASQTPKRSVSPSQEAPTTELAAKTAIMNSKLEGIRSLFSIEVALHLVHAAKESLERVVLFLHFGGSLQNFAKEQGEAIFVSLLQILGPRHVQPGFDTAVGHLSNYNPKQVNQQGQSGVTPLVTFLELVSVGDLIQQMVDVFYEQELIAAKFVDRNDFLDPAVKEKKKFEQMLDERVAAGLDKGIEVLIDEVELILATTQTASDFNPDAVGGASANEVQDLEPSKTAKQIVDIVSSHTSMLVGSTDKNVLNVFNQEVGVRLFTALCKHLKRQRISVVGSLNLISDMNHYFLYIQSLKTPDLLEYFKALRELSQIYLIDPKHAKEMATIIADGDRFHGIFRAEEVYEFAERRADWFQVKRNVERAMYGIGCLMM